MPVIKIIGPYKFRFHSRGEATEPRHIHVWSRGREAKFWLEPEVIVAIPGRFRPHEITEIKRLVEENRQEFIDEWIKYLG